MSLINNTFSGKLNLDSQAFRIQNGDFIDGLNITRDAPDEGQDIVVTNVVGNQLVSYSLPSGTNKVIGKFPDKIRNRVYIFIWNSNDFDLILYYDRDNDTIVKLIENITDTDGDVLNFNPSKRVNHIDIIYRDNYGDLVFFTDGNVTPRKFNVDHILNGDYTTIKTSFIEVAKAPPLLPPTAAYGSDALRNANSLRRKLFMFSYRKQYDDFEKSAFSPYSKIPLPVGFYGSDNDIDNASNNFITITVETGDENVIAIEIAMRYSIGDAWSDYVLVSALNKSDLSIPDNSTYQFLFYNDAIYPTIQDGVQYVDGVQVVPLFYWVPQLADCQALANGNTPVFGAITEGYNPFPVNELDVTMTVENVTNNPPDADPPTMVNTVNIGGGYFEFTIAGTIPTGTQFSVTFFSNTSFQSIHVVYTSAPGDTANDVAIGLAAYGNANYPGFTWDYFGAIFRVDAFPETWTLINVSVVGGGGGGGSSISTEKTWLWNANYIFGLVYGDDQNRDMPGVITVSNPVDVDNDFLITTPSFSLDGSAVQTPVISAEINHLPPDGAKVVHWVRRRQTYDDFLFYMTCDFQDPGDGFYYFCLANIEAYKEDNSQFIYATAPITSESRLKPIASVTAGSYDGDVFDEDYQILGTVTRTLTGGSSPDDDKIFIKVAKPTTPPSPLYGVNTVVMVYTPLANPTSDSASVYYEWAESYPTYEGYTFNYFGASGAFTIGETITGGTSGATAIVVGELASQLGVSDVDGVFVNGETLTGGTSGTTATLTLQSGPVLYHTGMDQDQTSFQPATFTFAEGDVYFHVRTMYSELLSAPYSEATLAIMDANFSDFFDSAVNDNGRAQVIEVNAQQIYDPVLYRFGGAYQNGTTVNNTPDFYFENQDYADRQYGDIRKFYIRDRFLRVYQKFKVGVVPILLQIIRDTAGNPLEANSDILLNKINYPYSGNYGIGDVPESFAADNYSDYFVDDYRGVVCRLSQDGITVLSVVYECNSFFTSKLKYFRKSLNNGNPPSGGVYTGDPTVYGVFDALTNKYIVALEEINRYDESGNLLFHQDPYTLSFNEVRNAMEGFESFLSYHPESMVCLDTLLITFKNGETWKHGFGVRTNFYGTQYNCYITTVFNDSSLEKKTWQALTQLSSDVWECPSIKSNVPSYGTTMQETTLVSAEFARLEGNFHSGIKRDMNSRGGKINGANMKGNYLIVKFLKQNASELIYLNGVAIRFVDSPLTVK